MNYVVSMFPRIDTTEHENAVEKGNVGESPNRRRSERDAFYLPGREGQNMFLIILLRFKSLFSI